MQISDMDVKTLSIKEIIDLAVRASKELGKRRKKGKDGWSPLSRLVELRISCLCTVQ